MVGLHILSPHTLALTPCALQVRGLVVELAPGDSLVVPAYWFLHSQLMGPHTLSLVVGLLPGAQRVMCAEALQLQVARMAEVWLATEVGAPNVRKWLQVRGISVLGWMFVGWAF